MEEPAWCVYDRLEKGDDHRRIVRQLTARYGLPDAEALRFAEEVTAAVRDHSTPVPLPSRTAKLSPAAPSTFTPFAIRHYVANGIRIAISYGSPLPEYYIHRPLAHLEVSPAKNYDALIEVFEREETDPPSGEKDGALPEEDRYFLRMGGACYGFREAGLIKRELFTGLANLIYGKSGGDWMAHIHASAVTDGREAILLSSASGSGKSTMAALLQAPAGTPEVEAGSGITPQDDARTGIPAGTGSGPGRLFFMSDDFVPVDARAKKAHCFPAAITIKKGSFHVISPLYDRNKDADASYRGPGNRSLRYLRPRFHDSEPWAPRSVKKIVFIRYNPEKTLDMERLDTLTALAMFHEEAWVSHEPVNAQSFIDWFARLECYRLDYSDNVNGVDAVKKLFDKR